MTIHFVIKYHPINESEDKIVDELIKQKKFEILNNQRQRIGRIRPTRPSHYRERERERPRVFRLSLAKTTLRSNQHLGYSLWSVQHCW